MSIDTGSQTDDSSPFKGIANQKMIFKSVILQVKTKLLATSIFQKTVCTKRYNQKHKKFSIRTKCLRHFYFDIEGMCTKLAYQTLSICSLFVLFSQLSFADFIVLDVMRRGSQEGLRFDFHGVFFIVSFHTDICSKNG